MKIMIMKEIPMMNSMRMIIEDRIRDEQSVSLFFQNHCDLEGDWLDISNKP